MNDGNTLTEDTATVVGNVLTNDFTTNNQTILNGVGNTSVVTDSTDGPGTRLDGFTITGGAWNGSGIHGGTPWWNNGGSPTLSNVTFSNNTAGAFSPTTLTGGGMTNINGSPTLTNVIFRDNRGEVGGAALWNDHSSPVLTNVLFYNNVNNFQPGVIRNLNGSSPTVTNATFRYDFAVPFLTTVPVR